MMRNKLELNQAKQKQRFSIRKLTVGAASVMIGSFLYLGGVNNNVMAETTNPADTSTPQTTAVTDQQNPAQPQQNNQSQNSAVSQNNNTNTSDSKTIGTQKAITSQESSKTQDNSNLAQTPAPESETNSNPVDDTNNNESETDDSTMDQAKQEAKINPVVAIKGEVPTLDSYAIANPAFRYVHDLNNVDDFPSFSDYDSDQISVEWTKAPDVSKIGETTGEAKITYTTYDDEGNPVTNTLPVITINVDVVNGEVKKANQVRNTLTVVDQDNKVTFNYTWLHNKSSEKDGGEVDNPALAEDPESIKYALSYLGLKEPEEKPYDGTTLDTINSYALSYVSTFGTTDKTSVVYVTRPKGIALRSDGNLYLNQAAAANNTSSMNLANPRATDYVDGLINLKPGDQVDWGTKPVFERDDNGNYVTDNYNAILKNNPSIVIKHADGTVTTLANGQDLKDLLTSAVSWYLTSTNLTSPEITSPVIIDLNKENSVPDAASLTSVTYIPANYFTDPKHPLTGEDLQNEVKKYYNIKWVIAPNLDYPGYQLAYVTFTPKKNTSQSTTTDLPFQNLLLNQKFYLQVLVIPKKAATPTKTDNPQPTPTPDPNLTPVPTTEPIPAPDQLRNHKNRSPKQ